MRYRFALWNVTCAGLLCASSVSAQEGGDRNLVLRTSTSALRRYEPDTWSALKVSGTNRSPEDQDALLVTSFDADPHTQFARRLWVPRRARRSSWLPVRVPVGVEYDATVLPYSTFQVEQGARGEIIRRRDTEPMITHDAVVADSEPIKTATLFSRLSADFSKSGSREDDHSYELIVVSREIANLSRATIDFAENFIPPSATMLQAIDQVILMSDRIVDDSAGIHALRQWLRGGGRLWIMADRVRPESVAQVLGDAMCYRIVDRVELTDYTIVDRELNDQEEDWSAEYAVEFLRVFSDAPDVHCEIDGWPAAFWQPFGDGEVLVTTLSAPGWLKPRGQGYGQPATSSLLSVANRFYQPKRDIRLPYKEVEPVLQENIGYEVPSRTWAASLLLLNCLSLAVVGSVLARRRQLEHLAWIVPLLSILVAALLLGVGMASSHSVPPTVAFMELVRTTPHSQDAHVTGIAAMYSPEAAQLDLDSDERSFVVPRSDLGLAETKRLVWNDSSAKWINLEIEPGSIRVLDYEGTRTLPGRVTARGRFGPRGLEGQLEAPGRDDFEDLLIANPPAFALAVQVAEDGSFRSGSNSVLSRNQYLADTLLSDQQRRRQLVYRLLLNPRNQQVFPTGPTLFAWTDSMDSEFSLLEGYQPQPTSLLTIPLALEKTPSQTAFEVPATFIRVETYVGRHGASTVFNPRTGRWMQGVMRASRTNLRFQLPSQVLPCRLEQASLTLKMNAPSREVSILVPGDGEEQEKTVRQYRNPSGVINLTLDASDILQLDSRGGLLLSLDVSPTEAQETGFGSEDNSTWEVDYVRMDVRGTTL